ncbi:ECF-type sigma factor [Anatilimnocola floriformis]|uniref:ECF-type sigma factor n=1 Tax=Anatilimnocola floriformis TaxID=2948575 RepID=UPI0020C31280|nr:ECF-type sigma factor [Anatilimnocola floriformis]
MSDDVRRLLAASAADRKAAAGLLPLVYDELRKLASAKMAQERSDHTLNATALVHEAYLRLVGDSDENRWDNRGHFFAAAAEAMRRILVEAVRRKQAEKHGGGLVRVEFESAEPIANTTEHLVALDEALTRLAVDEPEVAAIVELRYFAGLTIEQAAAATKISVSTANRHWSYAKAWLYQELGPSP